MTAEKGLKITDGRLVVVASAFTAVLAALFLWKPMVAEAFAAGCLGLLLVFHGPAAIAGLIAATFLFYPMEYGVTILPSDVLAFMLVGAYLVDLLTRGSVPAPNRIGRAYLAFLLAMLISIALEGFTALSVRYFLRQVVLAATFFAVAHFGWRLKGRRLLIFYVVAAIGNSLYALMQFLRAGGNIRSFGVSGHGFGDHAMLAFLITVVSYLWSTDIRARLLWGTAAIVTACAMIATQTRASIITAGWGVVLAVGLALWAGRRLRSRQPVRNLIIAIIPILIIASVLAIYTPVFEGIASRFGRLGLQASETVLLRVTLWKAALEAFWANPVFGIGAGNFPIVGQWIPDVRFDPVFYLVSGLSTHAILMTALAETGLVGLVALACFFFRAVRTAFRNFAAVDHIPEIVYTQCLLMGALAIVGSSLYAGSWFWGSNSYHMALIFGLIAAYHGNAAGSHMGRPSL